jgi:hypothetical protein
MIHQLVLVWSKSLFYHDAGSVFSDSLLKTIAIYTFFSLGKLHDIAKQLQDLGGHINVDA